MAQDRTTSVMGSKKIAFNKKLKENNILDSKGKNLSISFKTLCRYLNEKFWNPQKNKEKFFFD